jgi:hypothetical protein
MGRPRKATPARRYHLTVEADLANRIDAYAARIRKRPATTAVRLLEEAVCRVEAGNRQDGQVDELTRARQQIRDLESRVAQLRAQLNQEPPAVEEEARDWGDLDGDALGITPDEESGGRRSKRRRRGAATARPRWEWPLDKLLADGAWWDRWLPRLYELMGCRLQEEADDHRSRARPVRDRRGYSDLMTYLFPPIVMGERRIDWRSMEYPKAVSRALWTPERRSATYHDRVDAWETVIRHVVEALCSLERTGIDPFSDPYVRMRAKAEIIGPWITALRYMVGDEAPPLPQYSGKRRQLAGAIAHDDEGGDDGY